jgi:hypothetical protein
VLAIGAARSVEFRDARTYQLLRTYGHGAYNTRVEFGPDSNTVMCFFNGSRPQAIEVATAKQVRYPRWFYRVRDADAFAFSPDGSRLAIAKGRNIEVWTTQ